ncbi:hypothetical protein TNCV_2571671 [Trichonephila clavipes]|nr:hypothetical protein TNCV_2571671 [Trichonephila clavipes]
MDNDTDAGIDNENPIKIVEFSNDLHCLEALKIYLMQQVVTQAILTVLRRGVGTSGQERSVSWRPGSRHFRQTNRQEDLRITRHAGIDPTISLSAIRTIARRLAEGHLLLRLSFRVLP